MKITLSLLLALAAVVPAFADKKPVQNCKINFALVYVDRLDNAYRGMLGKQLEDVQKKLSKYGDVCYSANENAADYIFFVHTKPAVYHGVRTTSDTSTNTASNPVSGTITDEAGNTARIDGTMDTTTTTTTTSSVPYEVDYSVYILDVLVPHSKEGSSEKTFTVLHTFDQKGLYHMMYGISFGKGKNPIVNVIDAGAQWLHVSIAPSVYVENQSDEPKTATRAAEEIEKLADFRFATDPEHADLVFVFTGRKDHQHLDVKDGKTGAILWESPKVSPGPGQNETSMLIGRYRKVLDSESKRK